MSLDFAGLVDIAAIVSYTAGFAFSSVRAIQIGRASISGIYRRRAGLLALVSITIVVSNFLIYLPYPNGYDSLLATQLIHVVELMILVAFVDRTATVAMETDFFHRDLVQWRRVRKSVYVAFLATITVYFTGFYFLPPYSSAWSTISLYLADIVVFVLSGYLVIILFVGARRTPDVNLKGNLRLLGFSFATALFSILLVRDTIAPTGGLPLVGNIGWLFSTYIYYRAVMSLSPVGRVRASEVSEGDVALPSSSKLGVK